MPPTHSKHATLTIRWLFDWDRRVAGLSPLRPPRQRIHARVLPRALSRFHELGRTDFIVEFSRTVGPIVATKREKHTTPVSVFDVRHKCHT